MKVGNLLDLVCMGKPMSLNLFQKAGNEARCI